MMTKRSFFRSVMGIVATVALAPEIAFGRLKMPEVESLWEPLPYQKTLMDAYADGKQVMMLWSRQAGKAQYSELQRLRKEAGL